MCKKSSERPDEFGKGSIEGIAASEGANSSSVGGALIPLLALGIPGSATDAVLIGAFALHDLNPGPLLFQTNPEIVYGIFTSLFIANVGIFLFGLLGNRWIIKVVEIDEKILSVLILTIAVIGSFSVNQSLFDVYACIGFGVVGWIFKRFGYPVAPIVLGMVLGKMIEENFRRALLINGLKTFFENPLSLILLCLALASFLVPLIKQLKASARRS